METKEVIAIISTDWHMQQNNLNEIKALVFQQIKLCKEHRCALICLGDVFDSRVAQREGVLNAFGDILQECRDSGVMMYCIPGNHDKTVYASFDSFLKPFSKHLNFTLIDEFGMYTPIKNGVNLTFIPFFENNTWLNVFREHFEGDSKEDLNKTILFSHVAMQGSVNNDGSVVDSPIKPSMFEDFLAVYLGHYHDVQALSENVMHLPSIRQKNFGENDMKGFILLFDDGTIDFVKSEFKEYKKIELDANTLTKKQLIQLYNDLNPDEAYYRIIVKGDKSQLKAIDENVFLEKGIDFKKKYNDVVLSENDPCAGFELSEGGLSKSDVKELFASFCKEKDYSFEEGSKYLNTYFT